MANVLTTGDLMICPHGGSVSLASSQLRAHAGSPVLRPSDTFTVMGCPLNVSGAPHPCVRVVWVSFASRMRAGGEFVLTRDSVGMCTAVDGAPQGAVVIQMTQSKVSAT